MLIRLLSPNCPTAPSPPSKISGYATALKGSGSQPGCPRKVLGASLITEMPSYYKNNAIKDATKWSLIKLVNCDQKYWFVFIILKVTAPALN